MTDDPQTIDASDVVAGIIATYGLGPTLAALAVLDVALCVRFKGVRRTHAWALRKLTGITWGGIELLIGRLRGWSWEETRLMRRLRPSWWREHAHERGLGGTLTARARVTPSGIVVRVRLDGTWTVKRLRADEDHLRSLLGARKSLRIEIEAGRRGGWAVLTLRTRSAADGHDGRWDPEDPHWGISTVTGEYVDIPLGERLLLAGMSGAGKSVASRPLLHDASEGPANALVIIDAKRVEGRLWEHRATTAYEADAILALCKALVSEMYDRQRDMPRGAATWTPSPDRPRITVFVDEGAEVRTLCPKALELLETLARLGRASEIHVLWCTQKPTMSGPAAGIPPQIAAQMLRRISLAVSTPAEARTVLGEDATDKGWDAENLPYPGYAYNRAPGAKKPERIRVLYMDDATVMELPPAQCRWDPASEPESDTVEFPSLEAVPEPQGAASDPILDALEQGYERVPEIAQATGLSEPTVKRRLKSLIEAGQVERQARGVYGRAA